MADAIVAGGGHVVPLSEAEALVWAAPRDPDGLREALDAGAAPQVVLEATHAVTLQIVPLETLKKYALRPQ